MGERARHPALIRRLKFLGFPTYQDYLRSDLWADFKKRYRESTRPQHCIACRNPKYDAHHRSYERLGEEELNDVIPLCRVCHTSVHEYSKLHGLPIQATHKILRKLFGWTKGETRRRFAPFCAPGTKKGYRWRAPGPKPSPKKRARQAEYDRWNQSPAPRPERSLAEIANNIPEVLLVSAYRKGKH